MSREAAQAVKQALTNIPGVLDALGLTKGSAPNRRGRLILCPSHTESSPSCGVTLGNSGTIRVHCFSCSYQGDVFSLIGSVYGLDPSRDFAEVLQIGADMAGIELASSAPAREGKPRPVPIPRAAPEPPVPERQPATLDEELAFGRAVNLLSERYPVEADPGIAGGLGARRLLQEASWERWIALPKTGLETLFDDASLEILRPLFVREKEQGKPYVLFRDHRLLIPWRRPDGRVWSFQRRFSPQTGSEDPKMLGVGFAAPGKKPRSLPKFVWPSALDYLPREVYPFGVDAYEAMDKATEETWWTEGAADALALRALNRLGRLSREGRARPMVAIGLPGVQTIDVYAKALGPLMRGRRGIVGVDADAAGQSVARAWQAMQLSLGARESVIKVPPQKDWNLFLQAQP